MSNVLLFAAKKRNPEPAVRCGCCEHMTCYPHRVAAIADRLRNAEIPDEAGRLTNWLVLRSEVERLHADLLAELDEITEECLPDERDAR